MNINVGSYQHLGGTTLEDDIAYHHAVLAHSGIALTGTVMLVSDPETGTLGALQVWSETIEGGWVYIDADGVIQNARFVGVQP